MAERNPNAPDTHLEEARAFLEEFAKGMARAFGVEDAARTLGGCLLGLLVGSVGRAEADRFLSDVLTQLREDHPENWSMPESRS